LKSLQSSKSLHSSRSSWLALLEGLLLLLNIILHNSKSSQPALLESLLLLLQRSNLKNILLLQRSNLKALLRL
jgi:hypothetical protein